MSIDAKAWLPNLAAGNDNPIVVCVPPAGLAASSYGAWGAQRNGVQFVPVHLPGRQARLREAPLTQVGEIADVLAEILSTVHTGPLFLYGHSMGGTIAYELAMRLQERDRLPRALILGACAGPARWPLTGLPTETSDDAEFLEAYADYFGLGGEEDDEERELLIMLLESMLPVLRADIGMCQTYRAGSGRPALHTPVHVIVGEQDAGVPVSSALEWKAVAGGDFSARTVPGGHLFHQDEPETAVRAVLQAIEAS